MKPEESAPHLPPTWGHKTLEGFRAEAEAEASGIAFESIELIDDPKLVLIVCITGTIQIEGVCRALEIALPRTSVTWTAVRLGEVFAATMRNGAPPPEAQYDDDGRPTAMVLGTTDPRSIEFFMDHFGFSPCLPRAQ